MKYLVPFSLHYLQQLSIISSTVALINIGINSILGVEKKYIDLKQLYDNSSRGNRQLPPGIKRFENINNGKFTKSFFWLYISMVGIYFIIILISNFIPYFENIRRFYLNFSKGFNVKVLLESGDFLEINYLSEKIVMLIGVLLSWVELLIIISIYALFFIVLKKYINILTTKKNK